jgi:hypothetical protein
MPETTEAVAGTAVAFATAFGVAVPAGVVALVGAAVPTGVEEAAGSAGASSFGSAAAVSCGAPGAGVAPADPPPPVLPPVSCGIAGTIAATVVGGVGTPPMPVVGRRGVVTTGVEAGIVVATGAGVVTTGVGAGSRDTVHRVGCPATSTQSPVPPVPPANAVGVDNRATAVNAVAARINFLIFLSFCLGLVRRKLRGFRLWLFVITNGLMPECHLYL